MSRNCTLTAEFIVGTLRILGVIFDEADILVEDVEAVQHFRLSVLYVCVYVIWVWISNYVAFFWNESKESL